MTQYRLTLQSVRGDFLAPEEVRLRMLLKRALRQFGFRVKDYGVIKDEVPDDEPAGLQRERISDR